MVEWVGGDDAGASGAFGFVESVVGAGKRRFRGFVGVPLGYAG